MDKDQFQGILALKLVAEKRSFSAAAEELRISAPAVSKMIVQLEKKMKMPLLTRTTRSVNLTEAGSRFLEVAGPAMDQIIIAQENARTLANKPSGILKLNMPTAIFSRFLAPLIKGFSDAYPEITLDIYGEDKTTDIIANNFDAGIRSYDILEKDMVALKLFGPINWIVAASSEYIKKHGRPKHPKDLLNHNCIRSRFGMSNTIYDGWELTEKGKDITVKINGNLIVNDAHMLYRAALDGQGIIYTALEFAQEELKSKKLENLLPNNKATSEGFYLYFPKVSQVSPKLRVFIDYVHEYKKRNGLK